MGLTGLSLSIVTALLGTGSIAQFVAAIVYPIGFVSVIIGLLALVAWLVTASHWTTDQAVVTWALTFVLGLGHFAHCVASSGEIMPAVVSGGVGMSTYGSWLGAVMVSLLNYGQVETGRRTARANLRKAS
jgi:hypothetical protein